MKKAIGSNSKSCEHSEKECTCGGHNNHNHKKNKLHVKTKRKLQRRKLNKLL